MQGWPDLWSRFEQGGRIVLEAAFPPASFQGPSERKRKVMEGVRQLVKDSPHLIAGDVKVHVQWYVDERARYHTDSSADVDNIIKPILDGLTGPHGIIIDDCQVQTIGCHWETPISDSDAESFSVEIRVVDSETYIADRERLVFIQVDGPLCFPTDDYGRPDMLRRVAQVVTRQMTTYKELLGMGVTERQARMVLPVQRLFHKTRLNGFRIVPAAELID